MNNIQLFERILLIEDDPSHALLVKRAIGVYSGDIKECAALSTALEILASTTVDVVITDLHLTDGRVTENIDRLVTAARGAPIIVLTSSTDLRDAIEAMKRGASDFIVKNFDSNFHEVISFALSRIFTNLQLKAEQVRAQREIEILRVAIDNSQDGMAVIADSGAIAYANRSFASFVNLCGGSEKDLFAIFSEKVNKQEDILRSLKKNFKDLEIGGVWHSEVTFVEKKDMAFDVSLSAIPIGGKDLKNTRQYVLWVRDVSEEKRREKFQREILSTTTHDLKGPLGAIQLSCELLADSVGKEGRTHDLVVRIESSAQGAINLIDEFLSARRIQEGTFILRPALNDISDLIKNALNDFSAISTARNIDLTFESKEEGLEACVDKLGFVRVLSNLLSNAMKFTPKHGKVKVSCEKLGNDIHIAVEDTGSGMEPGEVQRIFERFSRLNKHQDVAGTGLGLFVVKSIVNAHGGKIEVTSAVGKGTRFDVSFPLNPPVNDRGELISLDFA